MPVTAKKIDGRWRVVKASSGRVERTSKGTARDGGGHSSKSAAMKQARAINSSESSDSGSS